MEIKQEKLSDSPRAQGQQFDLVLPANKKSP